MNKKTSFQRLERKMADVLKIYPGESTLALASYLLTRLAVETGKTKEELDAAMDRLSAGDTETET